MSAVNPVLYGKIKRSYLMAFCILYIFISRSPSFFQPILNIDEADFAVQTAVWLDGGVPYVDFVEKKPLMIHAAYGLAFLIGGTWNMLAVHLLFAAFVAATAILMMFVLERMSNYKTAVIGAILFCIYQAGYDLNDFLSANTEIMMNLFAVLSVYFMVLAFDRDRRFLLFVFSGVFACLAAFVKPVALVVLPPIAVADWISRRGRGGIRAYVWDFAAFVTGLCIVFTMCVAILANQGILDDAIRWIWTANIAYASFSQPLYDVVKHGVVRISIYVLVSLPLWVFATWHVIREFKKRNFSEYLVFAGLWMVFSFVAVSLGGRFFPHYFLQFLPALIILSSFGLCSILDCVILKRWILIVGIFIVVFAPAAGFMTLHIYQVKSLPGKIETELKIADVVRKISDEDSRIFVWGHNSDIYYFSRRLPSTSFVYCSFLTGASEGFEDKNRQGREDNEARRMAMETLRNKPADVIVDMSGTGIRGYDAYPLSTFPELDRFVKDRYRETTSIRGARIFVAK